MLDWIRMDQLVILVQYRLKHLINLSIDQVQLFKVHSRNEKLQLWEWNQIHGDFIQINVQSPFESHRCSQIAQHIGNDPIHLLERSLLFLFFLVLILLLAIVDYIYQSLVIDWKYTITVFDQFIQR